MNLSGRVALALTCAALSLVGAVTVGSLHSAGSAGAVGSVAANSVQAFGVAAQGDPSSSSLNEPIVSMADTPDDAGYWLVARDGGIFSYGDAVFHGSTDAIHLNQPIVGMAADAATGGYWLVARDGGVFAFDAPFLGSEGGQRLNQPVVGMATTADGGGYWLVARDGGVFTFGDAAYLGSEGGQPLNQPVVGMSASPGGGGYWLVASDGGIFSFGNAAFYGSSGAIHLDQPIVGMAATSDGMGYWLLARDGGVFAYGAATFAGNALSTQDVPAVALAGGGTDGSYRVAYGHTPSPFSTALANYVAARGDDVTMSVYDATTGERWDFHPGEAQVTASIVKVDIMAAALFDGQQNGGVPPGQAALMPPMIEVSDNNAATAMWNAVGGGAGLSAFNRLLGLQQTSPYPGPVDTTNIQWAYSTTSAADMVSLVSAFAFPNGVLQNVSRAYGLGLMHAVIPADVWGVPAGAPAGSVALKTGYIHDSPNDAQVDSIGYVSGGGRDYVFAVLTHNNPSGPYGVDTINTLATMVYDALAPT